MGWTANNRTQQAEVGIYKKYTYKGSRLVSIENTPVYILDKTELSYLISPFTDTSKSSRVRRHNVKDIQVVKIKDLWQ